MYTAGTLPVDRTDVDVYGRHVAKVKSEAHVTGGRLGTRSAAGKSWLHAGRSSAFRSLRRTAALSRFPSLEFGVFESGARSGRYGPGRADGLREALEPVGACGEDDIANACGEARPGSGVRVAEGTVA